jgi:hypothetical protein
MHRARKGCRCNSTRASRGYRVTVPQKASDVILRVPREATAVTVPRKASDKFSNRAPRGYRCAVPLEATDVKAEFKRGMIAMDFSVLESSIQN